MKNKLVSIVIVNWNGKENLKECFASLTKISYSPYEIIVVDNGSTDGSEKYVKSQKPASLASLRSGPAGRSKVKSLTLVQNKKNLGFAEANNIGFKKAKGRYVLLLNNDTKVAPDFLTKLADAMKKDEKIGVVQPKIILTDSGKLQAGGAFLTNSGFLYHFGYGKNPDDKKYNQQMEIFSANGSCMLVKRKVIKKIGLFDPDFFAYFEETDFCWRAWIAGYKIVYVPSATIYHKGGQTAKKLSSSFVIFHSFKNRTCSLIKNLGTFKLLKILPLHLLFCQLASFVYLMIGKLSSALAIQKAIVWNVFNLGKTLKKRKKIQQEIRKIEDDAFIPRLTRKVRLSYYRFLSEGRLGNYEE